MRKGADLICFFLDEDHAVASIGARPVNRKVLRMRNQLGCHTMYRWLPTRHFSCTYTTNHPTTPLPHFFSRRPPTTAKGCIKQKVVPLFRSLQAFGVAISLLFSPSLFPFLFPVCRAPTSTPPSGQPSSASSLLHCAYRINLLPPQANVPCSPAASSASFRCNVTPTTTGTLWIDHSTRCWYVLDHQVERSFSHQHLH